MDQVEAATHSSPCPLSLLDDSTKKAMVSKAAAALSWFIHYGPPRAVALRNTLLSHQVPYSRLHSATTAALKQMQASNFIRPFRAVPEKQGRLLLSAGAASGGSAGGGASGSGRGSGGTAATAAAAASGAQSPLGKNYFRATEKGSAVYKTGLPIPLGLELYDR